MKANNCLNINKGQKKGFGVFNYAQICLEILKDLPSRQKEVILRRFALQAKSGKGQRETLESIGKGLGVTRERVRQIERDGFLKMEPEIKKYQKVFKHFRDYFNKFGGLKKEEILLSELGGGKFENEVYFLLSIGDDFERLGETGDFYALWTTDKKLWDSARKIINSVQERLSKTSQPLKIEKLNNFNSLKPEILISYLEVSKTIQKNSEGFFGLKDWPEINPRKIKDKAYLVFKKTQKPLHFTEVAGLIDAALPQTVHNELIKDQRFILVGRGIYALKEWGYEQGLVKDVISSILKASGHPLSKKEILEKTLKQRLVKENTVFLNLSNKKYFTRNSEGFYTTREA